MIKLKFFVQNESLEELENRINKWIEEMKMQGGTFKDVVYERDQYGTSLVIIYEVLD